MPSAEQMRERRRVVVRIDAEVGRPYAVPVEERVPTLRPITATEAEYAVVASLTGSLRSIAWAMGVTPGQAKQTISHLAHKIPGTLPALVRVVAWTRGASQDVLGLPWAARHIPEHLLRPEHRRQTPIAAARPALASYGP